MCGFLLKSLRCHLCADHHLFMTCVATCELAMCCRSPNDAFFSLSYWYIQVPLFDHALVVLNFSALPIELLYTKRRGLFYEVRPSPCLSMTYMFCTCFSFSLHLPSASRTAAASRMASGSTSSSKSVYARYSAARDDSGLWIGPPHELL